MSENPTKYEPVMIISPVAPAPLSTSGVMQIAAERANQVSKHSYTEEHDRQWVDGQLVRAAEYLLGEATEHETPTGHEANRPFAWEPKRWQKMCAKDYTDRVRIAGALCAAELDRLNSL